MFRFKNEVRVCAETKDGKKRIVNVPIPVQKKRHLDIDDIIENWLSSRIRNLIGWCISE